MNMTPAMVARIMFAAGTILVLSLAILGAQYIAQQYAAKNNSSASSSSTPTPIASQPTQTSDKEILSIYTSRFSSARISDGGNNPIIFVTLNTDNPIELAALVNESNDELKKLGNVESVTLLMTYQGKDLNTSDLSKLVESSESIENQLIVQLG